MSANIITPFKKRRLDHKTPVKVYRNLGNRSKGRYSIVQNGLVCAHTNQLMLGRARFCVSEAGRQRVLRERVKNVHAYIKGYIAESGMGTDAADDSPRPLPAKIEYDPYKSGHFICANLTVKPVVVTGADCVIFNDRGVFAAYTYP